MNREFLKGIEGLTDEAIEKIMAENGRDIQKAHGNSENIKSELKNAQDTIAALTGELEALKDSSAAAEDWEKKFEDLRKDNEEKERLAKEEKAKAEKEAAILARYNAACIGKDGKPLEWTHEAIKTDYLKKFAEAIESADNAGKSDADIFHALTKDDAAAFKGITAQVNLLGGNPMGGAAAVDKASFAKMGYESRVKLYNENKDLYESLKED